MNELKGLPFEFEYWWESASFVPDKRFVDALKTLPKNKTFEETLEIYIQKLKENGFMAPVKMSHNELQNAVFLSQLKMIKVPNSIKFIREKD